MERATIAMMPDNTPAATNPVTNQNSASSQDEGTLPAEIKAAEEKVREDTATADWNDRNGKIALILYVIFTGLVGWTTVSSNRVNGYLRQYQNLLNNLQIAKVRADADKESKRIEADARKQIANAEAGAKKDAAEVKAGAEKQIAEVRANAETQIAALNAEAEKAREGIATAQATAATATEGTQRLTKENLELQARIQPRRLTPEKRNQLLEVLRANPKGSIDVECAHGDAESCALAKQFVGVLREAGWQIKSFASPIGFGEDPSPLQGVFLIK